MFAIGQYPVHPNLDDQYVTCLGPPSGLSHHSCVPKEFPKCAPSDTLKIKQAVLFQNGFPFDRRRPFQVFLRTARSLLFGLEDLPCGDSRNAEDYTSERLGLTSPTQSLSSTWLGFKQRAKLEIVCCESPDSNMLWVLTGMRSDALKHLKQIRSATFQNTTRRVSVRQHCAIQYMTVCFYEYITNILYIYNL
jgi:hypothetical protein